MNSNKWKSPFQKNKKERSQPQYRDHFGYLEKKKDYIQRARSFQKKENEIKNLKREAELRNPNEFYFSMITDNKEISKETKTKPLKQFSKEQKLLLENRDIKYIQMKIQNQKNKIEKLKLQLPFEGNNSIKIFKTIEEAMNYHNLNDKTTLKDNEKDNYIKEEVESRSKILKDLEEVLYEMKIQKEIKKDSNFKKIEDEEGNIDLDRKSVV